MYGINVFETKHVRYFCYIFTIYIACCVCTIKSSKHFRIFFWDSALPWSIHAVTVCYISCGNINYCLLHRIIGSFFYNESRLYLARSSIILFSTFIFLYLTAINIFIPSEYGSIESCGCFGEFIHFSPKASLIKTFFIWLLSFFVLIRSIRNNTYRNKAQTKKGYKQILILIILSIVPPIYSLLLFKHVCHGLYLIGYCCLCIMTIAYMETTFLRVKKIYH